ncbi:MAG: hypothetical protein ABII27_03480 [bacterium]
MRKAECRSVLRSAFFSICLLSASLTAILSSAKAIEYLAPPGVNMGSYLGAGTRQKVHQFISDDKQILDTGLLQRALNNKIFKLKTELSPNVVIRIHIYGGAWDNMDEQNKISFNALEDLDFLIITNGDQNLIEKRIFETLKDLFYSQGFDLKYIETAKEYEFTEYVTPFSGDFKVYLDLRTVQSDMVNEPYLVYAIRYLKSIVDFVFLYSKNQTYDMKNRAPELYEGYKRKFLLRYIEIEKVFSKYLSKLDEEAPTLIINVKEAVASKDPKVIDAAVEDLRASKRFDLIETIVFGDALRKIRIDNPGNKNLLLRENYEAFVKNKNLIRPTASIPLELLIDHLIQTRQKQEREADNLVADKISGMSKKIRYIENAL